MFNRLGPPSSDLLKGRLTSPIALPCQNASYPRHRRQRFMNAKPAGSAALLAGRDAFRELQDA